MKKVSAILVVLVINIITIAQPKPNVRDVGFMNHMRRVRQFPCKTPQLRAIPTRELLMQSSTEEQFYPFSTVLARCDEHTGCCSEGQTCAPEIMTEVELVFIVNHLIDVERVRHHEIILAKNHTRCHCVNETT